MIEAGGRVRRSSVKPSHFAASDDFSPFSSAAGALMPPNSAPRGPAALERFQLPELDPYAPVGPSGEDPPTAEHEERT